MDGDSGRVLYQKSGNTPRPNASTTKVMTCILALENGKGDDYVKVSANAISQPEVRLGLSIGEQYYLEDLLYSLMLQSHNDSAVAIAECIGGSVDNFSAMMNAKAKEMCIRDRSMPDRKIPHPVPNFLLPALFLWRLKPDSSYMPRIKILAEVRQVSQRL